MKRLTFSHIVNHREPKGTDYILDTMNNLRLQGHDFQFLFGERLSHEDAYKLYHMTDVLVEQLILGWYGAQAVELMFLGKVVVCNYLTPEAQNKVPPQMLEDCPIIQADQYTLHGVLLEVMKMPQRELERLGKAGQDYVYKYHDPVVLAREVIYGGENGYTITHG